MNPIRRELLNGLIVLVVASLLSVAFEAFQVRFNVQLWVLILMAIAVAVGGYVVFEFILSAEKREVEGLRKSEQRELEWLKRVGTPARLALGFAGTGPATALTLEAINAMPAGSNYTVVTYIDRTGGDAAQGIAEEVRTQLFNTLIEQLKRGAISEYKRIICFDHDVFATDSDLKSGILRVGRERGAIIGPIAKHCRVMIETKGCSLYVAPVVLRSSTLVFFGTDKVAMTVDTVDQDTGTRTITGSMFFCDPPNGEIIEQLRQIERAMEKRMVAVHKIVFPEDATAEGKLATAF